MSKKSTALFRSPSGYIYLLCISNKYYKIGLSRQPNQRLRGIRWASPFPVEKLHQFYCQYISEIEAALHDRFRDKRLNGEWFELSQEDVRWFMSLDSQNIYQEVNFMVPFAQEKTETHPEPGIAPKADIEALIPPWDTSFPIPGQKDAAYKAALILVQDLDHHLERGEHLRLNGHLCTTLDEVVNALREMSQ